MADSKDNSDVTLVRDDNKEIEAHKVILAEHQMAVEETLDTAEQTAARNEPKVMESLLLSVGHHWSRRNTVNRQVELLSTHFRQDEMYAALKELMELVELSVPAIVKRQPTSARTATTAQAEDVVNIFKVLGDQDKLPRFLVQSDDLPRVLPLLGALAVGDERGVAARLEALELAQRQSMVDMKRMVESVTRGASAVQPTAVPEIVVNNPSYAEMAGAAGGQAPQAHHQFFSRPAARPAGRQARPEGGEAVAGRPRPRVERSHSNKRRRGSEGEGEFQEVQSRRARKPRARAKAVTGTADLEEFADLAGPVDFWIGNTRANTTKEKVVEVLKNCALAIKVDNFVVDSVVPLTKEDNPRSRSWKVSVPARLEEVMANGAMYPRGWSYRVFHPGNRRQEEDRRTLQAPLLRVAVQPATSAGPPEGPAVPAGDPQGPAVAARPKGLAVDVSEV